MTCDIPTAIAAVLGILACLIVPCVVLTWAVRAVARHGKGVGE